MRVEPLHVKFITDAVRRCAKGQRRVRTEDDCIYVDSVRPKFALVRLRRASQREWRLEELSIRGNNLHWVSRARGALERLVSRWDDPQTLFRDLRVDESDPASAPVSKKDRASIRSQIVAALEPHRSWLVDQFRKLSSYSPPVRLRRIQFEWSTGSLHDGLSLGGRAVDAAGDDASEVAPSIPSRRLWTRAIGGRIGSASDTTWREVAEDAVEKWIVDCYRRAAPKLACPAYLSLHEGLSRGINLATGRRTGFRDD